MKLRQLFRSAMIVGGLLGLSTAPAAAASFAPVPLISDDGTAVPAPLTDRRLVNAWGMSYAPGGPICVLAAGAGTLLVGNFGDGRITAFDATTFAELGQVARADGRPLSTVGLWARMPGNGTQGGSTSMLYYTAGLSNEARGVFCVMSPNE